MFSFLVLPSLLWSSIVCFTFNPFQEKAKQIAGGGGSEKASTHVISRSSCMKDNDDSQRGEPSSLWRFFIMKVLSLFLLRFILIFHCVSSWFVYIHVVPTESTWGSQRPWASGPTLILETELGSSARIVPFLTTEPWLQTSPFSNIYLIICIIGDTTIFKISYALLNVWDKKSVLVISPYFKLHPP